MTSKAKSNKLLKADRLAGPLDCVIVTGLSGAGKTLALRALEDVGYFCVDNFPLELLPSLIGHYRSAGQRLSRLAVGVDVRTGTKDFQASLTNLKRQGISPSVLFLEADNQTLLRRFSETRRRHPLGGSASEGVRLERRRLNEIKILADKVIDTSHLAPPEMKDIIVRTLGVRLSRRMAVVFMSFGYKFGLPLDADLVWDVRFLPNPNYVPHLRPFTGEKPSVARYVLNNEPARVFLGHARPFLEFLVDQFGHEGKSYLTVAIGCTGGHHRSVAIARTLADFIRRRKGTDVRVIHRDAQRKGDTL